MILRPLLATPQFATTRSSRVVRPGPTRGTVSIRAQARQEPPKNLMESVGRVISRRGLMSNLGTGALFGAWVYLGWDIVQVRKSLDIPEGEC